MELTYTDIIQSLMSDCIERYIPDGIAHSHPIIGQENGKIIDCFFLFNYSYKTAEFTTPTARLAIDPYDKELIYFYDSKTKPFETNMKTGSYPLKFAFSKDERREALRNYQISYVLVRKFAFADSLNPEQRKTLFEYLKSFNALIPTKQKPYYIMLSPEFFSWMTQMLKLK